MNIFNYNCSINLLTALLWQDNDAVNTQALLQAKQDWYQRNHCDFWNDWVVNIFDLNTANEFGLRVWSEILDLPLFGRLTPSPSNYPAFGFETSTGEGTNENFDNSNFATDQDQDFLLTTEQRRILLKLRFFQTVTRGAIPEINRFLSSLFGKGEVYALDGGDMTMTYINVDRIQPELRRAIVDLDLLPRPASVKINYVDSSVRTWGFNPSSANFDNGNFIGG